MEKKKSQKPFSRQKTCATAHIRIQNEKQNCDELDFTENR